MERVKRLITDVPPCLVDDGISRPGAGGYNLAVWEEALKKETKGFAETIHYMIAEGAPQVLLKI